VRQIIASIAGGATLYSEAKRLNDESEPSPGYKYRGRPRQHGPGWNHNSIRSVVRQMAYSGTHIVNAHKGPVERPVPAIVDSEIHQKALARLEENRRYSGGKPGRNYLLRGLVVCATCGTGYTGSFSSSSGSGKRYYKYHCHQRRTHMYDRRRTFCDCPAVKAEWLEDLAWADVRSFLKNPGEVLQRVREQLAEDREGEAFRSATPPSLGAW
jgi:site-specific DNA recombinase